jgi:DNA-directed RNA polymerase specialized sigma subunit
MTRTTSSQKRGDETRNRIKSFMREYTRKNGKAPTMAETGKALGMAPQSVSKQMKKIGTIEITENMSRMVEAYRSVSIELLTELGIEPLEFAEKLDEIEVAYHYGEIHKAITELPEAWREYVWLRFWGGLTDAQAVRAVEDAYRGQWLKHIKPELAQQLKHLSSII